jgi:hypothetical protein
MQTDWASENLQVIRTLMERSAVYRRALAPVMAAIGLTGLACAGLAIMAGITAGRAFACYWMIVAVVSMAEALLLVRRQALKDQEPFWSLPTRRVTQALGPPFFCGIFAGLAGICINPPDARWLPSVWMVLYGCALHSAGFFIPRGIKLFGWAFVVAGCAWILTAPSMAVANWAMGIFFGGGHATYGLYLYFTEKRGNAA